MSFGLPNKMGNANILFELGMGIWGTKLPQGFLGAFEVSKCL